MDGAGNGHAPLRSPLSVAFVSTYVPRRCGIATFTRDLVEGLQAGVQPAPRVSVAAMSQHPDGIDYPPVVRWRIEAEDRGAYRRLARSLADEGVDVVCLQHEFGIFGGPGGSHVLDLLDDLPIPVVATLHTILAQPSGDEERVFREVLARSARLVTISERGRAVLTERYAADPSRIATIPHGVPDYSGIDRVRARSTLGVDGTKLIVTSGLLGPGKNVELVLDALAMIADRFPEATYAVLGATHPEVRRQCGEEYRERLQQHVRRVGLDGRVRFVNRYLGDAELAAWLVACDVFVTPYRNAQQVSSGTLANAFAAGAAVVSTPFEHAEELLGGGRGVLVPFDDPESLAQALAGLLADDDARAAIRREAREHARSMQWPNVARRYADLFHEASAGSAGYRRAPASVARSGFGVAMPTAPWRGDGSRGPGLLPGVRMDSLPVSRLHLDELRDCIGVAQFASGRRPDLVHGYCTDDVARTLRVDVRHALLDPGPAVRWSVASDLAFLRDAFDPARGRFRNFRAADGSWLDAVGSEDAHGRALHALGDVVALARDTETVRQARRLFLAALPAARRLHWMRPRAYAVLGCAAALADPLSETIAAASIDLLLREIEAAVRGAALKDASWPWPECRVTYDNGVIPEALIVAGSVLRRPAAVRLGLELLDWLLAVEVVPDGWFRPIGNRGWYEPGSSPAQWDQQPVEPASIVSATVAAWEATGDSRWAAAAERAFGWYLGANDLGLAVADPERGACRDGLGPDGVNGNEGAESTLSWLLSVERIRDLRQGRSLTLRRSGVGHDRTYASTSERRAVASAIVESAAP